MIWYFPLAGHRGRVVKITIEPKTKNEIRDLEGINPTESRDLDRAPGCNDKKKTHLFRYVFRGRVGKFKSWSKLKRDLRSRKK